MRFPSPLRAGVIYTTGPGGRVEKKERPHRQSAAARHFSKTALISGSILGTAVVVAKMMSEPRVNKVLVAICRFGQFPHRNAVLGRVNTAAEEAFLAERLHSRDVFPMEDYTLLGR